MLKKRRTWICLVALIGVALAVYFEPSHCARGLLWGEAFFDGRPTSYWREVVERDLRAVEHSVSTRYSGSPPEPRRLPRWSDPFWDWLGVEPDAVNSRPLVGDDRAQSVLDELAKDRDKHVAGFAKEILRLQEARYFASSNWRYALWNHRIVEKSSDREPLLE